MKRVTISLLILLFGGILTAGTNETKLYDVKSGKVEYTIKGSGEIMGQKIQTIGKKRLIFDHYGAQNLTEENKVEKQVIMGQKKINKTHTLIYLKGGMMYQADFNRKRIIRMENIGMAMAGMMGGGKNMQQTGESMMKQMGGKKTGTDKVLGYTCDIWELMGTKQCIYKGVLLRVETNIMGIKNTEVATKAEFDISLSKDDFKLPDFPIYDMEGNKLDKNKLDAMDVKQNEEMSQEIADGEKAMTAAIGALKESGFNMNNPDAKMTKAQEEAMKKAMIDAMGGEKAIVEKEKQKIYAEIKELPAVKKCYSNANTAAQANACEEKFNSEYPEHYTIWNEHKKREILHELDQFEKTLPCIEKARTFEMLKSCFPQE